MGWSSLASIIPAGVRIKPAKYPRWIPTDDYARGDVVKDDGVDADDRVAPDPDSGEDRDLSADPDVVLDDHRSGPAGVPAIDRRLGIGEMVPELAGAQHAIRPDLDPLGGDDGAAVQPGIAADPNQGLRPGRDQAIDFGMRPGVDVRIQLDPSRPADAKPAVAEEARSNTDPGIGPIGEGGEPAKAAGRGPFPVHRSDQDAAYDDLEVSLR